MTSVEFNELARRKQIWGLRARDGEDGDLLIEYVSYITRMPAEAAGRILKRLPDYCGATRSVAMRSFIRAAFLAYSDGLADGEAKAEKVLA